MSASVVEKQTSAGVDCGWIVGFLRPSLDVPRPFIVLLTGRPLAEVFARRSSFELGQVACFSQRCALPSELKRCPSHLCRMLGESYVMFCVRFGFTKTQVSFRLIPCPRTTGMASLPPAMSKVYAYKSSKIRLLTPRQLGVSIRTTKRLDVSLPDLLTFTFLLLII